MTERVRAASTNGAIGTSCKGCSTNAAGVTPSGHRLMTRPHRPETPRRSWSACASIYCPEQLAQLSRILVRRKERSAAKPPHELSGVRRLVGAWGRRDLSRRRGRRVARGQSGDKSPHSQIPAASEDSIGGASYTNPTFLMGTHGARPSGIWLQLCRTVYFAVLSTGRIRLSAHR